MVLISGSWKVAIAGLVASLVIFGVVYFAVIKPDQNTANQALKQGLQQTQQALNQAQKDTQKAVSSAGGTVAAGQQQLSKAQKLIACIQTAGTDESKILACHSQYGS